MLKWFRRLSILVLLVLLLWLFREYPLRWAGLFLVVSEEPQKGQAIMALSGDSPARVLQAYDLYRKGHSPLILLTRGPRSRAADELVRRGIPYLDPTDADRQLLVRLGVPEDSVVVLQEEADSTLAEAAAAKSFFRSKPLRTILLVTSSYHSRRARMTFNHVFQGIVQVISVPTPYDGFQADSWWRNRQDLKNVLSEYQKIVLYQLQFLWEWLPAVWPVGGRTGAAQTI